MQVFTQGRRAGAGGTNWPEQSKKMRRRPRSSSRNLHNAPPPLSACMMRREETRSDGLDSYSRRSRIPSSTPRLPHGTIGPSCSPFHLQGSTISIYVLSDTRFSAQLVRSAPLRILHNHTPPPPNHHAPVSPPLCRRLPNLRGDGLRSLDPWLECLFWLECRF
jgi:hypothetical protein